MVKESRFSRPPFQVRQSPVDIEIIAPSPALRDFVQYLWILEVAYVPHPDFTIRTFSDDSSGLIFHQCKRAGAIEQGGMGLPASMIYGMTTIPSVSRVLSPFTAIGVLFHPHALKTITGVDAHYLRDRFYTLDAFDKKLDWTEQITNAGGPMNQIAMLSRLLEGFIGNKREVDPLVSEGIKLIKAMKVTNVRSLKDYLKVSERQLERRFLASAGASPRHFIQTVRFKQALRFLRMSEFRNLGELAHNLEFADQSHFNRTFVKYAGISPGEIKNFLNLDLLNLLIDSRR
jgi:AraC-like DNA-binding protein